MHRRFDISKDAQMILLGMILGMMASLIGIGVGWVVANSWQ
jgi:ABC-type antimicrobial peptide transport system permease subunit